MPTDSPTHAERLRPSSPSHTHTYTHTVMNSYTPHICGARVTHMHTCTPTCGERSRRDGWIHANKSRPFVQSHVKRHICGADERHANRAPGIRDAQEALSLHAKASGLTLPSLHFYANGAVLNQMNGKQHISVTFFFFYYHSLSVHAAASTGYNHIILFS